MSAIPTNNNQSTTTTNALSTSPATQGWGSYVKEQALYAKNKVYGAGAYVANKVSNNVSYKTSAIALPIFALILVAIKKVPSIVKAHPIVSGAALLLTELFFLYKHISVATKEKITLALKTLEKLEKEMKSLEQSISSLEGKEPKDEIDEAFLDSDNFQEIQKSVASMNTNLENMKNSLLSIEIAEKDVGLTFKQHCSLTRILNGEKCIEMTIEECKQALIKKSIKSK